MTFQQLRENQEELLESYRAPLLAKIRKLTKANDDLQTENNQLRAVLYQVGKDYGIEDLADYVFVEG